MINYRDLRCREMKSKHSEAAGHLFNCYFYNYFLWQDKFNHEKPITKNVQPY